MKRRVHLLLLLGATWGLKGEVFWRHPVNLPQSWSRAYQSGVKLQDGEGEVTIDITGESLQGVASTLRTRHGDALAWVEGEVMAWGMIMDNGVLIRYLVQPRPEPQGGFWVTTLTQRVNEAGRPGSPPSRHQLRQLPHLPQSMPQFFSLQEENQTAVEISSTAASPAAALTQLSQQLVSDGWQASPANVGGFRLFVRRDRVAMIGAHTGKDGQTRVLRLHKPLGVR
jgi:hypothetical protein